ncbi:hypothetical protein [Streptococcus sanguinis]|uniref:Uncharacterized protein n=1 Tax=Streptococcus sanguinis TaxID=1305 RepID=A0A3R9GNN4_STRSA|nr:hypothetical protein [Streptococcus sanguinis]RSI09187.1 hypothetical protein D8887_08230 [Streptococcus sanguinis]RSI31062.1 hypothetical protein D8877_04850 [Streptococcus sanguinis]
MEREKKRQKKVKLQKIKMRKIHKKYSLIAHVQLWLERHSKFASFMDGGIILFSIFGIMYVLFGTSLIPKLYQEMSYVFPIIINFVFLVNTLYQGIFRDGFSNKTSVQGFLEPFLYINGPIFLLHLIVGLKGRNVKKIPSLLSLDNRYIWFPIATYLIFFFIPALTMLILKYNEKKRKNHDKRKSV